MTEDEMVVWHHQLDDMSLRQLQEFVMDREAWVALASDSQFGREICCLWCLMPAMNQGKLEVVKQQMARMSIDILDDLI